MFDVNGIETAKSIDEALAELENNADSRLLCGGTDILIALRNRKLAPCRLVYIGSIPELQKISVLSDATISIGSAACFRSIADNENLRQNMPALCEAVCEVGSPQIRNVASIGGNLCNGAVSADSAAVLYVCNAKLEIVSKRGTKLIPIQELHTGPGRTSLTHGELLKAIHIPYEEYNGLGMFYMKYGRRNAMEIATLGCAAGVRLSEDKKSIEALRLAFTVAAPTPVRCPITEARAVGVPASEETILELAADSVCEISPRSSWRASKEFRTAIAGEMAARTMRMAVLRAGGSI